jgi:nucleotide-binding universal stress UspA family protein
VVICATDFSLVADVACEAGALLARRFKSRLIVAHVVARRTEVGPAAERLAEYVPARITDGSVTTMVAAGDPAREIARLARQEQAELVLIGRHQGAEPLVPVGIEAGLAEVVPCPVVTVASLADAQVLAARFDEIAATTVRCLVCCRPLGERICFGCRAAINWQAMEHKWSDVLHEGPGLMGLGGARALGPIAGRAESLPGEVPPEAAGQPVDGHPQPARGRGR